MVQVPDAARRPSLWRHRDFLKLWSAETISQVGTQVSLLAIPLVAVIVLQATPFEVALLGTVEFLPFILLSLPAGAWVDRMRRRPVLIVGDLGRAAALVSIPIAFASGWLSIGQLYVVGFVTGCLTVFFDVAYQSYLPSLVERDQLVDGNAKLEISRSVAQVAGPGIAGALIALFGAATAIVTDALSLVGSALFVWRIQVKEPDPNARHDGQPVSRPSLRSEVASGLRYVLENPYLRSIAASTGTFNLFSSLAYSIYLVYLVRELGLDAPTIGLVFSIGNIGALGGAVVATRIAKRFTIGPTIVGSAFLGGPGMLLLAVAPASMPVPFLVASAVLIGFSNVVYNVNQVGFRQAITPERMQGRMNATMRFIVWGTMPIGSMLGGVVATMIGLHAAIWIGTIGASLAFLWVFFSPVRTLREMPGQPDASVP